MGQKINPNGFRVGIIKDWDSRWMAKKNQLADYIVEDHKIREFLKKKLFAAGISKIEIERAANKISVNIYTAKPGIVIGKGGTGLDVQWRNHGRSAQGARQEHERAAGKQKREQKKSGGRQKKCYFQKE